MNNIEYDFLPGVLQRFWRDSAARFGCFLLLALIIFSLLGPLFSDVSYSDTNLHLRNTPPGLLFFFGSDELGRSIFVRVCYGAKISLFVGLSAAVIDMVIGTLIGGFAALMGGKTEELIMRLVDILNSLPNLLIIILLSVVLQPGVLTLILAMTITGWVNMARITRSEFISLGKQNFMAAAVSLGASKKHLFFRHLLPNAIGPIITTMMLTIPHAIFTEAFLSFLGLGVQPPLASLGTMASDGLSALVFYPWRLIIPAMFITITIFSFYLIADSLRDAFDPGEFYG